MRSCKTFFYTRRSSMTTVSVVAALALWRVALPSCDQSSVLRHARRNVRNALFARVAGWRRITNRASSGFSPLNGSDDHSYGSSSVPKRGRVGSTILSRFSGNLLLTAARGEKDLPATDISRAVTRSCAHVLMILLCCYVTDFWSTVGLNSKASVSCLMQVAAKRLF